MNLDQVLAWNPWLVFLVAATLAGGVSWALQWWTHHHPGEPTHKELMAQWEKLGLIPPKES